MRPCPCWPGGARPAPVEPRHRRLAQVGDEPVDEIDSEQADRHVDEEDPAPVEVERDRAAQRRADHRPHQRGNREVIERGDVFALGHRAHEDEPSHRHHHRAAHALQEPGGDKCQEGVGRRAQQRSAHEHDDRRREYGARSVAVGHPAADRDEDGEADEIRRERQLERERGLADIGRDRGQRGRDHRRVHVFHEQRTGDDERNEDGALHGAESGAGAATS